MRPALLAQHDVFARKVADSSAALAQWRPRIDRIGTAADKQQRRAPSPAKTHRPIDARIRVCACDCDCNCHRAPLTSAAPSRSLLCRICSQTMDRNRKRKADSTAENGSTPSKRQKVPEETVESVTTLGLKVVEAMKNAKDKTGRNIADLFHDLPRKKEVPDYYDVIKLPIAISTVERKLRNNEYTSLIQVESDFKRMVANAKLYNNDGSEVYTDAERVRKMLHNWMKQHNPAHKDPNYVPFPTPIPDEPQQRRKSSSHAADVVSKEDVKEEHRPKRPTITLSRGRRNSEIHVAPSVETSNVNEFEGKSFGQVQEQIVEEMIQWKDEDDFAEFQPFVNLPSRSLTDYYHLIKKPMCLRMIAKRARGQHGRDAATGITDLKTWDAFEDEVSLIWKNCHEYNEDGSEMFELATKFKVWPTVHFHKRNTDIRQQIFLERLAQVKTKVDEPQGTRIKLNARPKAVLHLGSKPSQSNLAASPGVSIDTEALQRQKQAVQAGMNGHQSPQPQAAARTMSIPPVIKTEKAPGSPTIEVARHVDPSEAKASPRPSMPPPARIPSASPLPITNNTPTPAPYVPPLAPPAPTTFAETYARTRSLSEALLPSIQLRSHPQLTTRSPLSMTIPASEEYTHHSITLMLPVKLYHLQVSPNISAQLSSGRQYKLFVTVNGTRSAPSVRPAASSPPTTNGDNIVVAPAGGTEKKVVYDVPLVAGVNRLEVEIVAVTGRGGQLEVEKMTVFVNLMRH
ncbi:hypothetical protein ANO11243_033870 [Dothideomycetidae sp. 11243]|nr:hypothetical protein ANO11243_033870 [fungal sp. No.11243]